MNDRASNIRLATIYSLLAVILIAISAYFFYAAASAGEIQKHQLLAAKCIKEFEEFGIKANVRPQDHAVVSFQQGSEMMQDRVNASSMVIGRCAGYKLTEFCAGSGCTKPGILFVLESL